MSVDPAVRRSGSGFALVWLTLSGVVANADPSEHFDTTIAPLLARHCLECHSSSTRRGGLDLTGRDGALAGGEQGKAIVPGKPAESLAWQYVESNEMPKDRPPLSDAEKLIVRKWIETGAAWGKPIDPLAYSSDRRAGYDWWSLQPIRDPAPPAVKDTSWPRNDVDRFILARLESSGLAPSAAADRRTLVRRLYFDLLGLPPTPETVEKFAGDPSPQAYETLVDELLRSPHYGERWARHWLDVVRYGETQGFERNKIRDNAWRYRDWVIDAFNRDLPFDEFVRRQIAGDVLYPGDLDALLATGYHVCGTWDQVAALEGSAMMKVAARQDHIEDLVAALGQAFLGMTINCARCHDHKFDPIAQRDYYQIAALLSGVRQEEKEREGFNATRNKVRDEALRKQIADAHAQLDRFEAELRQKYEPDKHGQAIEGLQALFLFDKASDQPVEDQAQAGPAIVLKPSKPARYATEGAPKRLIEAARKSNQFTIEAWLSPAREKQTETGPARIVTLSKDSGQRNFTLGQDGDRFDVRFRTTKTDKNGIPSLAAGVIQKRKTHVVFTFAKGTTRLFLDGKLASERAAGGDLSNWDDGYRLAIGDELTGERPWDGAVHLVALYSRALNVDEIKRNFESESRGLRAARPIGDLLVTATDAERTRHQELSRTLAQCKEELGRISYSGPAHVIVPREPEPVYVLERGDFRKPGQLVSPAGLSGLAKVGLPADFGLSPESAEADRRIKLAQWLTDHRNPLPARVFVNRLWHYHFGRGLVDTPSDFGFSGGRPSHPELLDYLASRFVQSGWKVKAIHRLIVTSAAYRQTSLTRNNRALAIDADNRLLWRSSTRRLEGEAVRDAMLAVSGALNPQLGGPSYRDMKVGGGVMGTNAEFTDPTGEFSDAVNRRTIYRLWARSGNNPMLESLDCPDPSVMSPRRPGTITPVQALALLNGTFAEKCAECFAQRVKKEAGAQVERQIERAYKLALARPPSPAEMNLVCEFVSRHGLEQLGLVLFNSNEFLFVN